MVAYGFTERTRDLLIKFIEFCEKRPRTIMFWRTGNENSGDKKKRRRGTEPDATNRGEMRESWGNKAARSDGSVDPLLGRGNIRRRVRAFWSRSGAAAITASGTPACRRKQVRREWRALWRPPIWHVATSAERTNLRLTSSKRELIMPAGTAGAFAT